MVDDSSDAREGGRDDEPPPMALDAEGFDPETHRALASTVRRRVLYVLLEEHREWSRGELATALRVWDRAGSGEQVMTADRERVVVELHHNHLPRLDQAGLLSYDHGTGVVTPVPVPDAVERAVR